MEHPWQYGVAPPTEQDRRGRAFALNVMQRGLPGARTDDVWNQSQKFTDGAYVAISAIAKPVRAAEVFALRRKRRRRGRTTFGPGSVVAKSVAASYGKSARDDYERLDEDHVVPRVIARPQGRDGHEKIGDVNEYLSIQGRLTGESVLWGVPSDQHLARGEWRPVQLYALPTAMVQPQSVGATPQYPAGYYRLQQFYPSGGAGWLAGRAAGMAGATLDGREVFRRLYPHPYWKWAGYSALTACALSLDIAASIDQARWASMNRVIRPDLFLSVSGAGDDFLDQLKAKLDQKYGGSRQMGGAMVIGTPLADGEVKVQFPAPTPKDLDYTNSWEQATSALLAAFGVPKTIANLSTAGGYAELYAARRQFQDSTVVPECRALSDLLTRALGEPWSEEDGEIVVEVVPAPVENEEAEQSALEFEAQNGLVLVNEYRVKRNYKPLPGGDVPLAVFTSKAGIAAGTAPDPTKPSPDAKLKGGGPTAGAPPRPANPDGEGSRPPTGTRAKSVAAAMSTLDQSTGGALVPDATMGKPGKRKRRVVRGRAAVAYADRLLKGL